MHRAIDPAIGRISKRTPFGAVSCWVDPDSFDMREDAVRGGILCQRLDSVDSGRVRADGFDTAHCPRIAPVGMAQRRDSKTQRGT